MKMFLILPQRPGWPTGSYVDTKVETSKATRACETHNTHDGLVQRLPGCELGWPKVASSHDR